MKETVVVDKEEYESLKRLELLMLWFEICDVALTWEHYDEAYDFYTEDLKNEGLVELSDEEKEHVQLQLFI